jgi:CRP-like cAMP-binding protein
MGLSRDPWERPNDAASASPSEEESAHHQLAQSPEELQEESRKIRRLQIMVNMVTQVIAQDSSLSVEEASEMVADTRKAALLMFPDKELAFNLIYWPRLQRLMRERYRMQ